MTGPRPLGSNFRSQGCSGGGIPQKNKKRKMTQQQSRNDPETMQKQAPTSTKSGGSGKNMPGKKMPSTPPCPLGPSRGSRKKIAEHSPMPVGTKQWQMKRYVEHSCFAPLRGSSCRNSCRNFAAHRSLAHNSRAAPRSAGHQRHGGGSGPHGPLDNTNMRHAR